MRRNVDVCVGKRAALAGRLRYARQGTRESSAFEYARDWLAAPDRFPLEPALPLVPGAQFHKRVPDGSVFHAAIADTEPDGWARRIILREHVKRRDRERTGTRAPEPLDALDFLLSVSDAARVGALRLRDEAGEFCAADELGRRSVPPLVALRDMFRASRAVETDQATSADLAFLLGKGTSVGGLRPKCSVIDDDGRLCIGKFPSVSDERAVTKGEVLALRIALHAGVSAAEARLVECEDQPVALVQRFDRSHGGDRVMYISAATLLGVPTNAEVTYTEIADALRVHGADARADIEELFRRVALYVLITNVDDHLRNLGFLHVDRGKWRLSPAFDVNPFPDRRRELKTWISEETGPAATIDGLMSALPRFGIAPERARAIIAEVDRAVAKWRDIGRDLGMTRGELDAFADAFEHPERSAAARVRS